MINIASDENDDLLQKQRITWRYENKCKYITSKLECKVKKNWCEKHKISKLENGQIMKKDKLGVEQLYKKWQKKKNLLGLVYLTGTTNNIDRKKKTEQQKFKTSEQIVRESKLKKS